MPRLGDTAKERIMARANAVSGKRKEENELTPQSYETMRWCVPCGMKDGGRMRRRRTARAMRKPISGTA